MNKADLQKVRDAFISLNPTKFSVEDHSRIRHALYAIDAALAAEPQRPVGMVTVYPKGGAASCLIEMSDTLPPEGLYSLYTAPVSTTTPDGRLESLISANEKLMGIQTRRKKTEERLTAPVAAHDVCTWTHDGGVWQTCCGASTNHRDSGVCFNCAKPVVAPEDWEGVAADQAMTIAMLKVDYQQLQALVTSQGIRLMEAEDDAKDDSVVWHSVGELEQAIKDAAKWRRLISSDVQVMVMGSTIAAAMEQKP